VLTFVMAQEGSASGRLFLITGPSGVGKGTLVSALLQRQPRIWLSISATTRSPRSGEVDGQHYFFMSRERFEASVAEGGLLEWAEFAGNCYGTPREPVQQHLAAGQPVPELIRDPGFVIHQANKAEMKARMWGAQVRKK